MLTERTKDRLLVGTPNDQSWPGVSAYPYYKMDFPQWTSPRPLKDFVSFPDADAEDLLTHCLLYIPEKRFTAAQARAHRYFHSDHQ